MIDNCDVQVYSPSHDKRESGWIHNKTCYLFQVSASDEILADREEAMQNLKSQVDSYLPFILGTYIK